MLQLFLLLIALSVSSAGNQTYQQFIMEMLILIAITYSDQTIIYMGSKLEVNIFKLKYSLPCGAYSYVVNINSNSIRSSRTVLCALLI